MVISKQDLIDTLQKEVHILVHLAGKVKPEMLDYRPTPKQRSVIELLRYMTVMGPVLVRSIKAGAFLMDEWTAADAAAAAMGFDEVVASLASQAEGYVASINDFSDEELATRIEMFGSSATRGRMLVDMIVAGHAAYRTQLFCYLKSCGREELNTMNLWAGIDAAM